MYKMGGANLRCYSSHTYLRPINKNIGKEDKLEVMTSKPSSINLHAKQKGKGLVLTFGYLLDQKVTYL